MVASDTCALKRGRDDGDFDGELSKTGCTEFHTPDVGKVASRGREEGTVESSFDDCLFDECLLDECLSPQRLAKGSGLLALGFFKPLASLALGFFKPLASLVT